MPLRPSRGIVWYRDTLTPTLHRLPAAINIAVDQRLHETAQDLQDYMQQNAPWEDITGDARRGLTAEVQAYPRGYSINLFHTVDYGIWLEIRWGGKYAIIEPTLEAQGKSAMEVLDELLPEAALIARGLS